MNRKYFNNQQSWRQKITHRLEEKSRSSKWWRWIMIGGASLFFISIIAVVSLIFWLNKSLPDPNKLKEREIAQSTQILDRTGQTVLYEIHGDQKRTLMSLSDIPEHVKQATIAIEDKDFYKHGGFSFWAIARTAVNNVVFGKKAGASTLTQQFIKNTILTKEKTYTRKAKELILAYRLERKYSKDEILQMYLNEMPYGSTAYGVEAASQIYYGKSIKEVSLAEAAVLAAIIQAPTRYSPFGSNRELLLGRGKYVLDLMKEQGLISPEEAEAAKTQEITFKKPGDNIKAPHFVMYVKEILTEKYGEKAVEQGGLRIQTTLDLYKQGIAENIIKEETVSNQKKYNAANAALLSIDPKTGQVLAMVGSRDYFDDTIDGQVNITTAKRQPGSSIKPIVYAAAFMKGYSPNTMLYDVLTNFSADQSRTYTPKNFNLRENGPVSMRKALAGSLNIPAVKTLYLAGLPSVVDLCKSLGYSTLNDLDRFGLSFVLGGGEVKMTEHVNAFSAFAREGVVHPVSAILKIEDANGKVLEEWKSEEKRVFEQKIARMINDILSDNGARAYIFGTNNNLTLGKRPVAAKSGTTNDFRDAWTIGYTPSIVTGVWVGNNDNSEMKNGAAGGMLAAPIWQKYMKNILGETEEESFKKPELSKTGKAMLDGEAAAQTIVKIDKASGKLATEFTPASFTEERIYSQAHCLLYYVDKNNPLGPVPTDPSKDPQFNLWEKPVQEWLKKQASSTSASISDGKPPTEFDDLHIKKNLPVFTVSGLNNGQELSGSSLQVSVEASAPRGVNRVDFALNGNQVFSDTEAPYGLDKYLDFLSAGYHKLNIKVCDDIDNCSNQEIEFKLLYSGSAQEEGNIGVLLNSPTNNANFSTSSFPISFSANLSSPRQTSQAELVYKNESGQSVSTNSVSLNGASDFTMQWQKAPAAGKYQVWLKIKSWSGQSAESNKINITINK